MATGLLAGNPLPLAVTRVPASPLAGESEIDGLAGVAKKSKVAPACA